MMRLSKYEQEGRGPIGMRISNPPLDPSTLLRVSGVGGSHSEKEEDEERVGPLVLRLSKYERGGVHALGAPMAGPGIVSPWGGGI